MNKKTLERRDTKMPLPPLPDESEVVDFLGGIIVKIGGGIITFLAGVVSATWIVATKFKGFDDRLKTVEETQRGCPGKTLQNIDGKLDRLHERIDDILLQDKRPRNIQTGDDNGHRDIQKDHPPE